MDAQFCFESEWPRFSAKKKDEILAEIDQNGDGEVDYDEFVTFYHKLKETMGDEVTFEGF